MKLVLIGCTGLIGSKLVTTLIEQGHDAAPAALDTGINTARQPRSRIHRCPHRNG